MKVKTQEEIAKLAEGGKRLHDILYSLLNEVRMGVSTLALDEMARQRIREVGGIPSFLGYGKESGNPFPGALCVSIDEEVVHGIPRSDRIIQEGDIVSLDIGMWYEGLATDMARTVIVGEVDERTQRLVEATQVSLDAGISTIRDGSTIREFSEAVEEVAKRDDFGVVRDLVGHGVGHAVHEPPQIPNYKAGASSERFEEGMVIALEPMLSLGGWQVDMLDDGWTFVMADGSRSAHFEDSLAVTKNGVKLLTR